MFKVPSKRLAAVGNGIAMNSAGPVLLISRKDRAYGRRLRDWRSIATSLKLS